MMKLSTFLLAVLLAFASASADLVVEQKLESAAQNGTMTMKIKGSKLRTDLPSGPAGTMSSIIDLATGDTLMLVHQQKVAMKASGAQTKQMVEAMKKQLATSSKGKEPATKPSATGKTEKVGEFETEIYTWDLPSGSYTFWVAKDFPDYQKIKPQLDQLNKAAAAGGVGQGVGPDYSALPGIAVKTMADMSGQKVTTTVLSVKETPVEPGLFEAPKDYQQIAQPALPAGLSIPK